MSTKKSEYNNYPFYEVFEQAGKLVEKGLVVYQKFTCDHCGSRQTIATPNSFHRTGICEECKLITNIEAAGCNYMVHAESPNAITVLLDDLKKHQ